jgi:hypothetical protein
LLPDELEVLDPDDEPLDVPLEPVDAEAVEADGLDPELSDPEPVEPEPVPLPDDAGWFVVLVGVPLPLELPLVPVDEVVPSVLVSVCDEFVPLVPVVVLPVGSLEVVEQPVLVVEVSPVVEVPLAVEVPLVEPVPVVESLPVESVPVVGSPLVVEASPVGSVQVPALVEDAVEGAVVAEDPASAWPPVPDDEDWRR